jgi:hypothetical protein
MATFYRRDEVVQDAQGNGVSGVQIYVCNQPSNTSTFPPSPLIPLYADPLGATVLTAPPETNAYGHCSYYLPTGIFAIVYYSPQIAGLQVVLPDQIVARPDNNVTSLFNFDTSLPGGGITGAIDGVNKLFLLSGTANPGTSLIFLINGLGVGEQFSFDGHQILFDTFAPPVGTILAAHYEISLGPN